MRTSRIMLAAILLLMPFLPNSVVLAEDYLFSGYDYLWFNPGHYLHYTETYDTEVKDLEVVYQETVQEGIFITLNFLDDRHYDSSLLGGSHSDKIMLTSGYPSSNEFTLWYLIKLPQSFTDGDMWKHDDVGYRVDYIGGWIVNGKSFSNVIKISINSLNYIREYNRGEGEVYMAKDIGIIDWEFRKANDEVFRIKIEDWGELPPRNISGRLTLDGRYPAVGYHVGLSNRHENDATSKITDEMGRFSFTAYGHKLTLRYSSILSDGGLDWDELTKYELVDIDSNVTDLVLSLGYPPIPVEINIDGLSFENKRVDIGATEIINLHCSWAFDSTDAIDITVKINGINYNTNQTGWISFPLQNEVVGIKSYEVTYVSDCAGFNIKTDVLSPIWDKVTIQSNQTIRLQPGETIPLKIAYYEYDKSPFKGSFILNDTITNKPVGEYVIRITGINDEKYNLTKFSSESVNVIIDQITFNIVLSDQRLDLGKEPEIAVSGTYEYDNKPFTGVILLSEPQNIDLVSEHIYKVVEIQDNEFGFTSFMTNEVTCLWDRIKITQGGVSNHSTIVGEDEIVWFKAIYEYDEQAFDNTTGRLLINGKDAVWSQINQRWEFSHVSDIPNVNSFTVTGVVDDLYGLEGFRDTVGELTIEWREVKNNQGISGFTNYTIVIGLLLSIIIIFIRKKHATIT